MSTAKNIKSWQETRVINGTEVQVTVGEKGCAYGYVGGVAEDMAEDMKDCLFMDREHQVIVLNKRKKVIK